MSVCRTPVSFFSILLVSLIVIPQAEAQLRPEQVGILALKSSRDSRNVAAYYARVRKIPPSQILYIDAPGGESLDEGVWRDSVRPAIRSWLQQDAQNQIRCLVTVWDVPLKIGGSEQASLDSERAQHLEKERARRIGQLRELTAKVYQLGGVANPPASSPDANTSALLVGELEKALVAAQQNTQSEPASPELNQKRLELRNALLRMGGWSVLVQQYARQRQRVDETEAARLLPEMQVSQARLLGEREGLAALQSLPETAARDQQLLALTDVSDGWAGSLRWIESQLEYMQKNETYASFDSELSLVLWPDYPLLRWHQNLLTPQYDGSPVRDLRTTLMVSRIEAPTLVLTKNMIDTSIKVEREGLRGKVYIDARGLTKPLNPQNNSYWEYDNALNNLAELLQKNTKLSVTLDTKDELFAPGSCPDAALYCGWYSLGKYIDAFDWVPGAVGYHLASAEATTLRAADSEVWCKRMLEDGVCATIGPVHEPYLAAFPKPDEFFGLLLTGKYTLVECYYRTKPFNSWVMILAGDPLYNPFAKEPLLQLDQLPESVRPKTLN